LINNIIFSAGTFLSKFLMQIGIFIILSKYISIREFGILTYAFSISWFLTNLIDFGYRTKNVKDFVKNINNSNSIFLKSFNIKIIISIISILLLTVFLYLSSFEIDDKYFILSYSLAGILLSFSYTYIAELQALGKFNIEFLINMVASLIYLISIILFISFELDFYILSYLYLLYVVLIFLFSYIYSVTKIKLNILSFNKILLEFKEVIPYAILVVANIIYVTLDVIILKEFYDFDTIAIYQVFMKIIGGLMIFFHILYSVFLPKITLMLEHKDYNKISMLNQIIFSIGFVTFVTYYILGDIFIDYAFGDQYNIVKSLDIYIIAIVTIKYLMWFIYEILLVSSNNQNKRVKAYIIGLSITIVLYFVLIPIYGLYGAIYSSLIGTAIIGLLYTKLIYQEFEYLFILKKR